MLCSFGDAPSDVVERSADKPTGVRVTIAVLLRIFVEIIMILPFNSTKVSVIAKKSIVFLPAATKHLLSPKLFCRIYCSISIKVHAIIHNNSPFCNAFCYFSNCISIISHT